MSDLIDQVVADESEIPLDDDDDKGEDELNETSKEQDDLESSEVVVKELTPHQLRMQALMLKMNQARQLNRQAVQEEGSNQARPDRSATNKNRNEKPNAVTSLQAAEAVQRAHLRAERQDAAQHSMHDYHNPEAQHRQYQRSTKAIYKSGNDGSNDTSTFDPLLTGRNKEDERQGAQRLAQEMHRRIDKKRRNDAKKKDKEEDTAGHINKRNKQFNKKLDRNYKEHVKEIQHNLERGTAL